MPKISERRLIEAAIAEGFPITHLAPGVAGGVLKIEQDLHTAPVASGQITEAQRASINKANRRRHDRNKAADLALANYINFVKGNPDGPQAQHL
jgi:hypothetical protein